MSELTEAPSAWGGDRDRSRAEPGSRTVLAGSLVALALEGLLELLGEDEEVPEELDDVVPDAGEGAAGPSLPSYNGIFRD